MLRLGVRLRTDLALERADALLVLAQRRAAPAEIRIEPHERAVHGLLQRIEREQSERGLRRAFAGAATALLREQLCEGLERELAQPLPLAEQPFLPRPLIDDEPREQVAAIRLGGVGHRLGRAVRDRARVKRGTTGSAGAPVTFIVRVVETGTSFRAVVERVTTGRKEQVHTAEGIGRAIAAMSLGEERSMSPKGKHALVTSGSRGIGRGIALKLAEQGVRVAVHYYENEAVAKDTLDRVRKHGSDGFLVQADLAQADDVRRLFADVAQRFGTLDVFVANGQPELVKFYQKPLEIQRG